MWSDPSIYEDLDMILENRQQQKAATCDRTGYHDFDPGIAMHLSQPSSSSARPGISYRGRSSSHSGSGSLARPGHLSQSRLDLGASNLVGLSQAPLSQGVTAAGSTFGFNSQTSQQYQQPLFDCNSHFPHHPGVQKYGGGQSYQRPPGVHNQQCSRGTQSCGQSYSGPQSQFNNLQPCRPCGPSFIDIPSTSQGGGMTGT